ncbi:MAG: hypothetical protein JKP98_19115 [Rhodobacteraceae bacterium]|nr:hypothetical protein [Paracoccaceae bacterium]
MNLTFSWHQLQADELNNLGGNPALSLLTSRDIGNEYTGTLRWASTATVTCRSWRRMQYRTGPAQHRGRQTMDHLSSQPLRQLLRQPQRPDRRRRPKYEQST